MNYKEIHNSLKIDEIDQPEEWKKEFKEFANELKGFMILAGKNGTGKTTSAAAICKDALVGGYIHEACFFSPDVCFIVQSDLYLQYMKTSQYGYDYTYILEKYSEFKLLVIDDLGDRKEPSPGFIDFLYALIEKRERKKDECGTIITTNMTATKMREVFGDAIVSRIASGKIFKYHGDDRRFKNEF